MTDRIEMILYSSTFLTVCHILVVFYVLCRRTVANEFDEAF